nr:histidine kinase dimerization/phosphoacceptor domain -containing protein [uncultured Sphingomonas sp.]
MNDETPRGFAALPTPLKILLIISLALLPIGLAAAWMTKTNLDTANAAADARARDQAQVTVEALRLMTSRNALATRVAANAALANKTGHPCADVQRILAVSPAEGREFDLLNQQGARICSVGDMGADVPRKLLAPGDIAMWIPPTNDAIYIRSGVIGGATTVRVRQSAYVDALQSVGDGIAEVAIIAGDKELVVRERKPQGPVAVFTLPFRSNQLKARVAVSRPEIGGAERLLMFLPMIMWAAAAVISWWMVHRLVIRPLRKLQGAVSTYQPGDDIDSVIPPGLGPAREIHELGDAFQRAMVRIDGAEKEAREALDGQRRLVREVHHRVKNNLQVVASLLSIHGRNASEEEARRAYVAIGRRVDALSVVHRNHFAELEENRGIALRPLVTELAAGLRGSAPSDARATQFELEIDNASTTQDVAVATAFLITEIVEFALLRTPGQPVRIAIRRTSELTANLSIESAVLIPDSNDDDEAKIQFERIAEGLARQLRSPLDRRLGRYSVTLPVFPEE